MFLKYLFSSRKRPYVKGINNPDRISVNLQGCELQLTLPPHYSSEGFEEAVPPRDIANIYATNLFDKYQESKPFGQVKFIRRDWSYFGPFWKSGRSEEHTSELQSRPHLVCRLLLEKKKQKQ